MPFEITLPNLPEGYAVTAAEPDQPFTVTVTEFTSSEDSVFISRLEGLPDQLLQLLPVSSKPSQVDHLVAIVRRDRTATVYLNECPIIFKGRARRSFPAGTLVSEDDFSDILSMRFEGVTFPADAGVVCLFSHGWRKGLFYDLAPLGGDARNRDFDVEHLLGSFYAYLGNAAIFRLSEKAWSALFSAQWFPFIGLPRQLVRDMSEAANHGLLIDVNYLEQVESYLKSSIDLIRGQWTQSQLLASHRPVFETALDRFAAQDYVSATGLLFPRIEGLLRTILANTGPDQRATQGVLSQLPAKGVASHQYSWLLPDRFSQYLEDVFFANFTATETPLSRHSVGHGVAPVESLNVKGACLGILIVQQLVFLFSGQPHNTSRPSA